VGRGVVCRGIEGLLGRTNQREERMIEKGPTSLNEDRRWSTCTVYVCAFSELRSFIKLEMPHC
jgi:hypothetical protein